MTILGGPAERNSWENVRMSRCFTSLWHYIFFNFFCFLFFLLCIRFDMEVIDDVVDIDVDDDGFLVEDKASSMAAEDEVFARFFSL